jgi:hypothetical protein
MHEPPQRGLMDTREAPMIRHRCAACGHHINRTDHLFEDSDGTLCAACLARLASRKIQGGGASRCAPPPAWAMLPELIFQRNVQG